MHIGNRVFSYPILNANQELSQYKKTSIFNLALKNNENEVLLVDGDFLIIKDIYIVLKNKKLEELLDTGKVKCACIIECSATVFRNNYDIDKTLKSIRIPVRSLKDEVEISAYLYANEDLNYTNEDFEDLFSGATIDIDKFDILAVDDGYKFKVNFGEKYDNKVASIFTIIKKNDLIDKVQFEYDADKIAIYLGPDNFQQYDTIKYAKAFNTIAFGLLVIPVLSSVFDKIKKDEIETDDEDDTISELLDSYKWFASICNAYRKAEGVELTKDTFINTSSLELAQIVFNNASYNALKEAYGLAMNSHNDGGDDNE